MGETFWEKRLEEIRTASFNQSGGRAEKHAQQYMERGFDDSDTWSLDTHLAKLILPRLKRYKELADETIVIDFPLDDMIEAFQLLVDSDWSWKGSKVEIEMRMEKIEKGLKAFAEHYLRLWW